MTNQATVEDPINDNLTNDQVDQFMGTVWVEIDGGH